MVLKVLSIKTILLRNKRHKVIERLEIFKLKVKLKVQENPSEHGGYGITYYPDHDAIKLSMPAFVQQLTREYLPELAEKGAVDPARGLLGGTELRRALDKLELGDTAAKLVPEQRRVRSLTFKLKWLESSVMPKLTLARTGWRASRRRRIRWRACASP